MASCKDTAGFSILHVLDPASFSSSSAMVAGDTTTEFEFTPEGFLSFEISISSAAWEPD